MELKLEGRTHVVLMDNSINRTFMELKRDRANTPHRAVEY